VASGSARGRAGGLLSGVLLVSVRGDSVGEASGVHDSTLLEVGPGTLERSSVAASVGYVTHHKVLSCELQVGLAEVEATPVSENRSGGEGPARSAVQLVSHREDAVADSSPVVASGVGGRIGVGGGKASGEASSQHPLQLGHLFALELSLILRREGSVPLLSD
jgi:hypothetical protein